MSARLPAVDGRDQRAVLDDLLRHVPGYTPEWSAAAPTTGLALMQVFARYMQLLLTELNRVPDRSALAFLDMLGTHLLPAQAARAPLVFNLIEDSSVDVALPANSQVAAQAQAIASSALQQDQGRPAEPQPVLFATDHTVTLSRGRLAALYSIQPGSDEFADHTEQLTTGFTLFNDLRLTEHAIYLGHDQLFALAGEITVLLSFSMGGTERRQMKAREGSIHQEPSITSDISRGCSTYVYPESEMPPSEMQPSPMPGVDQALKLQWEYLTDSGWLPFTALEQDDTTDGLRHDGQIALRRECGPDAKMETFEGRSSYWLRGRLTTPLLPEGTGGQRTVRVFNDIRARLFFGKADLLPEAAFSDAVPLDATKDFYPFGQQPVRYATLYLASKEVFQRKGARVRIGVTLSQKGQVPTGTTLPLAWEYYDGTAWSGLGTEASTGADTFTTEVNKEGTISFLCPRDWAETTVNGVKNFWLRVRITEGDYGQPLSVVVPSPTPAPATGVDPASTGVDPASMRLKPSTLQPPAISKLTLGYSYLTDPETLDHCLSQNDFIFEDHSEACRWPDQTFRPFQPVADRQPTVHFGFDRPLPVGLVSLYVDVPQADVGEAAGANSSPFVWEYRSAHGWTELGVLDETLGFRRNGMIQFIGPADAVAAAGLGGALFRIRARLKQGERPSLLPVAGIWLNAVWATQSTSTEREPLGTSDGNPGQTFSLQRTPVLENERIEVQEWVGRGEHWRTFVQGVTERELRFERDPATDDVTAVWVRWYEQPHLYDSAASDRHYVIERFRGLVRFGDGRQGLIPPAGSRISAFLYRSGGGLAGNVFAGAISELRTAVPFLMGATNPVPASGGAVTESEESCRVRGPQRLRHRDRAVSAEDLEWLAREASPDVARVRCLPLTGPAGHAQRGWVTLVAVPHSQDAQPRLTPEFQRRIREHLARRVPATLVGHLRVVGPRYAPVGVLAAIAPKTPDQAARVEARVRDALNRFLHPLTGGAAGQGWTFGQTVYLSQIAGVIEGTEDVDYAREISLRLEGHNFGEAVPVDVYTLPAAGDHELKLIVGGD